RQAIAAFQREADMLAQLSNEHIPRVIDRFSEANHHYLVMEYIDGLTLEDRLKQAGGKLAPEPVVDVAIQILETLEYLHDLSPPVIYRDLKPSNVMITPSGRAKLIDFGIARHFAPLTNATMIGTQGYAPPEQYRGKVEARSDLYALGATMHHALSGRDPAAEPPFSFPPLRKVSPEIDPALAAAVDQALAYDVVNRLRDASDFKRRLIELQAAAQQPSTPARAGARSPAAQMQLPLDRSGASTGTAELKIGIQTRDPAASAPASAEAATVVIASPEVKCRNCARTIPADSRYCSFCGIVIRRPSGARARPNDPTVILSPAPAHQNGEVSGDAAPGGTWARRRRSRGIRHPLRLLILIVLAGFFATKAIVRSTWNDQPPPVDGGDASAPAAIAPPPADLSALQRARLFALRQALDNSRFNAVRFQLEDGTLVLSGTISSEDDRATVQMMCVSIAGIASLRDNLRVADPS
ncbi:MAG: protein kinase domain-containing protein, partial [Candidatus Binataceae bacterium]